MSVSDIVIIIYLINFFIQVFVDLIFQRQVKQVKKIDDDKTTEKKYELNKVTSQR